MTGVLRRALTFVADATMGRAIRYKQRNLTPHLSTSNSDHQNQDRNLIEEIATPTLSQPVAIQHERAILVDACSSTFGNECLRLVNIAFHTSQTFLSMMRTSGEISRYIRNELLKQYLGEHFHIIIGENNMFGFAITDDVYFAEIEQEQYRVIIFTTPKNINVIHSANEVNSQLALEWKSKSVTASKTGI